MGKHMARHVMFMEGQIQLLEVKRRKHQATLAVDRHSTDARPIPNKACYSGRTRLDGGPCSVDGRGKLDL